MTRPADLPSIGPAHRGRAVAIVAISCVALLPLVIGELVLYEVTAALAAPMSFASLTQPELFGLLVVTIVGGLGADRFGGKPTSLFGLGVAGAACLAAALAQTAALFRIALPVAYLGAAIALPGLVAWGVSQVDRSRWGALLFPWSATFILVRGLMPALQGIAVSMLGWRADMALTGGLVLAGLGAAAIVPGGPVSPTSTAVAAVFGATGQDAAVVAREAPYEGPERRDFVGGMTLAGLALVFGANVLATTSANLAQLATPLMALPVVVVSLAAVVLLGLQADRRPWLTAASTALLAACCGLVALAGASFGVGASVALFMATVTAAAIASVAYLTLFLGAWRKRVGLAAGVAMTLYVLTRKAPVWVIQEPASVADLAPASFATVGACLASLAAVIAVLVVPRSASR